MPKKWFEGAGNPLGPGSTLQDVMDQAEDLTRAAESGQLDQATAEGLTKEAKALNKKAGRLFSVYYSLASNLIQWGAAEKPRGTPSPQFLREAAKQSLVDRLIIGARLHQIRHVAHRVIVEGKQKGFSVLPKTYSDPSYRLDAATKRRCDEMEELVCKPHPEVHPQGISDFLVKAVRGQLVLDRVAMIMAKDSRGRPRSFWLLPPDGILPRLQVLVGYMAAHHMSYDPRTGYDQATEMIFREFGVDLTNAAYAQVLDDRRLSGAWSKDECSVLIVNPTDEINRWGWGVCVPYDTRIETDRGKLMIGKIVRDRLPVSVRTYNYKTKTVEWSRVVNWASRQNREPLVRIAWRLGGHNGTGCYGGMIRCTPDHPILTPCGWKRAKDVTESDAVMVAGPVLSPDQEQVILGSLLGDMSWKVRRSRAYGVPGLAGTHGSRQRDYAEWKIAALASIGIASWPIEPKKSVIDGHTASSSGGVGFQVRSQHCLTPLFRLTCPGGEGKVVTRAWLDRLGPLGLAVWFMDDGSCGWIPHKSRGRTYFYRKATFWTNSCSREECGLIVAWLEERWGIRARISSPPSLRGQCVVRLSVSGTRRLFGVIDDYVEYVGAKKMWKFPGVEHGPMAVSPVPIVKVDRVANWRHRTVYDIEVEGTHTFLVNGAVVHNSPLEESLEATTYLMLALHYNKSLFTTNYPEAMLILSGEVDQVGLEAFKKQIYAEVGPQGNTRLPVLATGNAEVNKAQLLRLRDTLRDMQFPMLVRMGITLKTAAYRMHPSTIGFSPDQGGQRPMISHETQETQIALAQEEGFTSLLDSLAQWLTRELIEPWYDDLELIWSVQNQPTELEEIEIWEKKLGMGATVDEWRESHGSPPLEEATGGAVKGDYVNSPYFFQAKQAALQAQQSAQQAAAPTGWPQQGEEGYGGMEPPGGPPPAPAQEAPVGKSLTIHLEE